MDGRFRGEVNQVLAGEFDLARLTIVTQTLSQPLTDFRWVHIIAGEDDINGLGLGVISVPLAAIPVASPVPQFVLYGTSYCWFGWETLPAQHRQRGCAGGYRRARFHISTAWERQAKRSTVLGLLAPDIGIYGVDRATGMAMLLGCD